MGRRRRTRIRRSSVALVLYLALVLAVLTPGRVTDPPGQPAPRRVVGPLDACGAGWTPVHVNEAESLCVNVSPPLRLLP